MKKNKWFIPWILICILVIGVYRCFCDVYYHTNRMKTDRAVVFLNGRREITLYLCIALMAAVLVFVLYSLRLRYAIVTFLGITAIYGGILALRFNKWKYGLFFVRYLFDNRMSEYQKEPVSCLQAGEALGQSVFVMEITACFLLIAYLAIFVYRIQSRGHLFFYDIAALAMGMAFGRTPQVSSVALLVVGTVGSLVWITREEKGRNSLDVTFLQKERGKKTILVAALALTVIFLVVSNLYAKKVEKRFFRDARAARHQNETMITRLVEGGKNLVQSFKAITGVDNNGVLSNKEPEYTESTVMEVSLSSKPKEAVYLRGFTGDIYQNGRWTAKAYQSMENALEKKRKKKISENDIIENVWNLGFQNMKETPYLQEMMAEDVNLTSDGYAITNYMKIEYVGAGRFSKYTYLPYYTDVDGVFSEEDNGWEEGAEERNDTSLRVQGDNHCKKAANSVGLYCYLDISKEDEEFFSQESSSELEKNFLAGISDAKLYKNYATLAKKIYTQLPENGLEKYRMLGNKKADREHDVWENVNRVRNYLWQNATYSLDLKPLPEGEDYAENFLFSQHKGYCEHFATAGTLLLRVYGVPARYVTGYKIDPDQFEEDSEGYYTAKVKDSDSHAWSEVFMERLGWVKEEMTPSSEVVMHTQTEANQNTEKTKKIEPQSTETEEEKITKEPVVSPKNNKQSKNPSKKKQQSFFVDDRVALICVVIGLFVFLFICRWGHFYESYCMKKSKNNHEKVRHRIKMCYRFMCIAGISDSKKDTDSAWLKTVGEKINYPGAEKLAKELSEMLQKEIFSKEEMTNAEWISFRKNLSELEQMRYCRLSWIRKAVLYLFGYQKHKKAFEQPNHKKI